MERTRKILTQENLYAFAEDDRMLHLLAYPTESVDKDGRHICYHTVTYPVEYVMSEDQIMTARGLFDLRRAELIDSIVPGELVFGAMGGRRTPIEPDGFTNYRARCQILDSHGNRYLIEVQGLPKGGWWVSEAVDYTKEKIYDEKCRAVAAWNREHLSMGQHKACPPQDYNNAFGLKNKQFDEPYTYANILKRINEASGCRFTSCRLIQDIVSYEDYVCVA